MKVKDTYLLQRVMDQNIVININGEFNGILELNDTSACIWNAISEGCSMEEAAIRLTVIYDVPKETALNSVTQFCREMVEHGFFEDIP